jgi:YfiH family protein
MKMLMATSRLADGPMGRNVALSVEGKANREKFIAKHFGEGILAAVTSRNEHGTNVFVAAAEDAGRMVDNCDGLITTTPNLPLAITHQDCVPIVISDDAGSFVCVLHAGWRGVVAGILPKAIELIRTKYTPENMGLYFGAGIGSCHFEVQQDVADQFTSITPESVIARDGKLFVDMHAALLAQAVRLGIDEKQIVMSGDCTFHDKTYASWRRDGNREANMVTVAMLSE